MVHYRLVLQNSSRTESDVYICTEKNEQLIGRVFRHQDSFGGGAGVGNTILLWSARDKDEINHGDFYLDEWSAAKQLALYLGFGDLV